MTFAALESVGQLLRRRGPGSITLVPSSIHKNHLSHEINFGVALSGSSHRAKPSLVCVLSLPQINSNFLNKIIKQIKEAVYSKFRGGCKTESPKLLVASNEILTAEHFPGFAVFDEDHLKNLLTLIQYCFCYRVLVFWPQGVCGLSPQPGIEPALPAWDTRSPDHWLARAASPATPGSSHTTLTQVHTTIPSTLLFFRQGCPYPVLHE